MKERGGGVFVERMNGVSEGAKAKEWNSLACHALAAAAAMLLGLRAALGRHSSALASRNLWRR